MGEVIELHTSSSKSSRTKGAGDVNKDASFEAKRGTRAAVGLIGLAVMGENLARNIERNGFSCAVYNRTTERTSNFVKQYPNNKFIYTDSLESFVEAVERPRKIIIMVKAGAPVDQILTQIMPLLDKGDILIDGGNAHYEDTIRRESECRSKGVFFLGVGISGGEEGALNGASIMPGGEQKAWEEVSPLFSSIAASVVGEPCTAYMGPDGAGHFVKMVHNGIEYGDMQLIAEVYDILHRGLNQTPSQLSDIFSRWNEGVLESFLIEITAKIFSCRDDRSDGYLIDKILDAAEQKGTGKWTVISALDLGVSVPTIAAAVDARVLSSLKKERVHASEVLSCDSLNNCGTDESALISTNLISTNEVHDALYAAKILSYAQGLYLLQVASETRKWELNLGTIAKIWRGGCIIRARFLDEISSAFDETLKIPNLLLAPSMRAEVLRTIGSLRKVVAYGAAAGIPVPALAASLAYFDSYRTARLPQNLTQAQRDFFGAHTFARIDASGLFHMQW